MKITIISAYVLFCLACSNGPNDESSNVDSIANESNITPPPDLGSETPANDAVKSPIPNDADAARSNSTDTRKGKGTQEDSLKVHHRNSANLDTITERQK